MSTTLISLHQCLEQELKLAREFIGVLEEEAQVLVNTQSETELPRNTEKKTGYADRLSAIGRQREYWLLQMGYPSGRKGLESAVAQHPTLEPVVNQLLVTARRANELNNSNGVLIDTFLKNNQQTLHALRTISGQGNLYDARGRATPASGRGSQREVKA